MTGLFNREDESSIRKAERFPDLESLRRYIIGIFSFDYLAEFLGPNSNLIGIEITPISKPSLTPGGSPVTIDELSSERLSVNIIRPTNYQPARYVMVRFYLDGERSDYYRLTHHTFELFDEEGVLKNHDLLRREIFRYFVGVCERYALDDIEAHCVELAQNLPVSLLSLVRNCFKEEIYFTRNGSRIKLSHTVEPEDNGRRIKITGFLSTVNLEEVIYEILIKNESRDPNGSIADISFDDIVMDKIKLNLTRFQVNIVKELKGRLSNRSGVVRTAGRYQLFVDLDQGDIFSDDTDYNWVLF